MKVFLLVAVGGLLGAICRFAINNLIQSKHNQPFPWGTLIINITGCLLLGLLSGCSQLPREIFLVLGTGFMGAFTTFSTFELETVELIQRKQAITALMYVVASVAIGISLGYVGYIVGLNII